MSTPEEEQGLELAKEGVKQIFGPYNTFFEKLLGPAANAMGEYIGDRVKDWISQRKVRFIEKAQEQICEVVWLSSQFQPVCSFPSCTMPASKMTMKCKT